LRVCILQCIQHLQKRASGAPAPPRTMGLSHHAGQASRPVHIHRQVRQPSGADPGAGARSWCTALSRLTKRLIALTPPMREYPRQGCVWMYTPRITMAPLGTRSVTAVIAGNVNAHLPISAIAAAGISDPPGGQKSLRFGSLLFLIGLGVGYRAGHRRVDGT